MSNKYTDVEFVSEQYQWCNYDFVCRENLRSQVQVAIPLALPTPLLSTVRVKIGWVRIMIMCHSRATCIPMNCCFSELVL